MMGLMEGYTYKVLHFRDVLASRELLGVALTLWHHCHQRNRARLQYPPRPLHKMASEGMSVFAASFGRLYVIICGSGDHHDDDDDDDEKGQRCSLASLEINYSDPEIRLKPATVLHPPLFVSLAGK